MHYDDSFFTNMQGYVTKGLPELKGKNKQTLWGRYFAICFKEVLEQDTKLLRKLFGDGGHSNIDLELCYTRDRRADIAIRNESGHITSLIEIKIADKLLEGQLESYIQYCKKNNTSFYLVTRWQPSKRERKLVRTIKGQIITLSEIYTILNTDSSFKKYPLTKMFCRFLQESEMIYDKKISGDLLFLSQKVYFTSNKKNPVKAEKLKTGIPQSFSTIFTNLEILTREIMEQLNISGRQLSLNLWFSPYSNGKTLNKISGLDEDDDINLKTLKIINCGQTWFTSLINIGDANSSYCTLEFGLCHSLHSNNKKSELFFYWQINPDSEECTYGKQEIPYFKKDQCWNLPSKEEAVSNIINGFKKSKNIYERKYSKEKSKETVRIRYLKKIFK